MPTSDFDESAHPRADDGKFGAGGGKTLSRKAKETVTKGRAKIAQLKDGAKQVPIGKPDHEQSMATEPSTFHKQKEYFDKLSDLRKIPGRQMHELSDELTSSLPVDHAARLASAGPKRDEAIRDAQDSLSKVMPAIRRGEFDDALQHIGAANESYNKASVYEGSMILPSRRLGLPTPDEKSRDLADPIIGAFRQYANAKAEAEFPEKYSVPLTEYHAMTDKFTDGLTQDQKFAVRNYSNHSDKVLNPLLRKSAGNPDKDLDLYTLSRDPSAQQNPDHEHSSMTSAEYKAKKRDPRQNPDSSVGQELKDLDAAIASHKLDKDITVYRTMADPGGKLLADRKPGDVFTDHGYSSTSVRRSVIESFASLNFKAPEARVDVYVALKKGMTAAPIAQQSEYPHERELLLPRGSSFRITKITPATETTPKQVHVDAI